MQEADEQDTCRICSAPAEPDQPLFHPCKCSGTIRYIHQDCLTTWLSHSKKKNCDVCKHPYSFTKVYATDMPSTLPPILLVKKLLQQALFALLFGLRGVVVGIIWLAALPWATVWTWRMYFSMGESTAWWISGHTRPATNADTPFYYNVSTDTSDSVPTTFLGRLTSHPVWAALSADIFTGQIIASLIVLTFVAVFLLREWISQNARPGIFEDEDMLPDDPQFPIVIPLPGGQPQVNNPLDAALAQRQIEALRDLNAMHARNGENGHIVGGPRRHGRSPLDDLRKKGKYRHGRGDRFDSDLRTINRRKLLQGSEEQGADQKREDRRKRRSFARRAAFARQVSAKRREFLTAMMAVNGVPPLAPAIVPMPVDPQFAFTFTANTPVALDSDTPSSPDRAEPPRDALPFSFHKNKSASAPPPTIAEKSSSGVERSSSASSLEHVMTKRPSLPASTLHTPSTSLDGVGSSGSSNLVTYCAPEELEAEAGPSLLPAIGGEEDGDFSETDEEITEQDYAAYFGRPPPLEDIPGLQDPGGDESDNEIEGEPKDHVDLSENDDDDEEEEDAVELEEFRWEDVEVDGEGQPGPPIMNPVVAVAPDGEQVAEENPAPANGDIPPEVVEELEGNVEDDMEGAMEAIGMRGPIYGVLQNAALMIFVLDTAIGLGIWIPFTVGKTTALLSMDPPRFLQILHLPIRAIRLITDPIVDTVVYVLADILVPAFVRIILRVVTPFFNGGLWLLGVFGPKAVDAIVSVNSKLASRLADSSWGDLYPWSMASSQPQATVTAPSFLSAKLDELIDVAEPHFATLGMRVRLTSLQAQLAWMTLAIGEAPVDRIFAIVLGYAVVGVLLCIYLNLLTIGNAKSAGRAVRSAVRQQLLVLKVAAFIFIELVTFPLSCGVVLDLCTVWLFPEANLTSRATFFIQAPLTATFYHWVAGTMFMYSFAVLLAGCRTVMRPGAMWFVKDPQDANAHPIRDILDRPTFTQLRKICISGVLYSCVVACVVGSVAGLLLLGSKSVMPFKWKNREPLSNVPVDLLFLHIVLPYTMHYFRPKRALKEFATITWKVLSTRLRLTSYFFGGRHQDEEHSTKWRFLSQSTKEDITKDGTLRRVPATDHLALPRDMRATAAVNEKGEAADEAALLLIAQQNAELDKAKRSIKDEFTIVYIPPMFRYRIISFIALLWVIGAIALGTCVALPILLGRRFFELFTPREVHDGYSLLVGFYLLWGFYLLGSSIDKLDKRRQRTPGDRNRADLPVLVVKRGLLWVLKSLYMAACLGVVIPTLISFVIDLYIILPIRFTLDPNMTPKIRVVDTWALGLLYAKIAFHASQMQPPNRMSRGIQHIINNGWTKSDPIQATKEVIGPIVGGLVGMIVFPGAVFRLIQYLFPHIPLDDKFIFMHIYPGIFMFAGLVRSTIILYNLLSSWAQSIRDKEFLVEMRLRNHEPEQEKEKETETETGKVNMVKGPQELLDQEFLEELGFGFDEDGDVGRDEDDRDDEDA